MPKSPEEMIESMKLNLQEKTGKPWSFWTEIVKKQGAKKHGELVKLLKTEHGLGHGYANMVVHSAAGGVGADKPPDDDLVAAQYAGEKAALRPLYDRLLKEIAKLGKEVEVSPKKTYVSLRRSKQFALIQPSTKTRLDVGLNLRGVKPAGRLEASGSFNAMCTHRVRVEKAADIDKALLGWLKQAFEAA